MLKHLTQLIEQTEGELTLAQLSRELGASPSAVAGMLEILIHKGRIIELDADCGICETCILQPNCTLAIKRARRYRAAKF